MAPSARVLIFSCQLRIPYNSVSLSLGGQILQMDSLHCPFCCVLRVLIWV